MLAERHTYIYIYIYLYKTRRINVYGKHLKKTFKLTNHLLYTTFIKMNHFLQRRKNN